MTGASAALRARDGECPAQRVGASREREVERTHGSHVREYGRARCHRCGQVVGVVRRWDDGRWGWSPWRYEAHLAGGEQS